MSSIGGSQSLQLSQVGFDTVHGDPIDGPAGGVYPSGRIKGHGAEPSGVLVSYSQTEAVQQVHMEMPGRQVAQTVWTEVLECLVPLPPEALGLLELQDRHAEADIRRSISLVQHILAMKRLGHL